MPKPMSLNIRLDLPLPEGERKTRGLPNTACRLLVSAEDSADMSQLAQVLNIIRPDATSLVINAVGSFIKFERIASLARANHLNVLQKSNSILVSDTELILELLTAWKAESLAMFFTQSEDQAMSILQKITECEAKWYELSRQDYMGAYLATQQVDPVISYSRTHNSLELIGSRERILYCFEKTK